MPYHPEIAILTGMLEAEQWPSSIELPRASGLRNFDAFASALSLSEPCAEVRDLSIPGPAGAIAARRYRDASDPRGTLVYLHGGGWAFGGLDSHDGTCRSLARESDATVLSVDYRLAPEHPFPAGLEDCVAATEWAAAELPGPLAVAGDSAGGNLAAAVALELRDRGGPELALQVLIYPPTVARDAPRDPDQLPPVFLTRAEMDWYWDHYLRNGSGHDDPRAALALADLAGLPPAYVVAASGDPLYTETVELAHRLEAAGVPTTLRDHRDMVHGFVLFTRYVSAGRLAIRDIGLAVREAFDDR